MSAPVVGITFRFSGQASGATDEAERVSEFAAAINEAAVEMRELESVVGHGRGAAAAAQAP